MNEHLHIALDKNYFIKIDSLDDENGCIAHFPRNLFQGKSEVSYIYLVEHNGIALYNNSFELISQLDCEPYTRRALIHFDILIKGFKLNIPPSLTLCYKNEELQGDYRSIKNLIKFEGDEKLELAFVESLKHIKDDTFIVDKEMSDIFNFVKTKILTTGDILC